jgi:4'-phosphopantetheinyl transferase
VEASHEEVHVWSASLRITESLSDELEGLLAPEELERASRFRRQQDRLSYVTARGILRTILGRYIRCDPGEVNLSYNANGKPRLAGPQVGGRLCFNASHSGDLALYAVALGRRVGIDVERIRQGWGWQEIAERFFTPGERAALESLPELERQDAFFACWTRKEAYVKARGEGLSLSPDRFEVTVAPDEPPILVSVFGDPAEAARWSLMALSPCPGYAAALAVEGRGWAPICWQFCSGTSTSRGDFLRYWGT